MKMDNTFHNTLLNPNQVLHKRYQLQQFIGTPSQLRQTWLAIDLQSANAKEEKVVIKLLAFGGSMQWEHLKLFEREAKLLKQLKHPQIPGYRDYFQIDEEALWFGLVEDYIAGPSLRTLLNQGQKFTESEIRRIASSILEVLVYLHGLNPPVLHRDIKPSNIILAEDNQVYLIDFGSVQNQTESGMGTFTVVGTHGYTPIEQFEGQTVQASDLYALGITLIELATGISPRNTSKKDLRLQLSSYPDLSSSFSYWLRKITEPSTENRFSNAQYALQSLCSNKLDNSLENM
jgi:serine/threonine protein kinase